MAGLPRDQDYVTGGLPPEMREGVNVAVDIAPPTAISDIDGQPAQLTRVTFPRPDYIPPGPPRVADQDTSSSLLATNGSTLQYDFPLLPGVQCRVIFQGELTADHLEQLSDYLGVACKRLREQAGRDAMGNDTPSNGSGDVSAVRHRRGGKKTLKRLPEKADD